MSKAPKYTICRLSDEGDKKALLKLWNENHDRNLDEKYEWFYDGNPAGEAIVSLVREDGSGEYVGCSATFPRKFSLDGDDLRAGVPGDLFVSQKHRVVAPGLNLVKRLISIVREHELDLLYIWPNKNAEPVLRRAGFRHLGPNTRVAKIVRTSEQLQKRCFCKYLIGPVSALLDAALRLFAFETWYRFKGEFVCEEMDDFDERFDDLWRRSRPRFKVVGERTSGFLRWKYLEKPDVEYRIYAIFNSKKDELKGYVVHCMDENSISLMDLVLPEDRTTARIFVSNFLRHVKKQPISSVVMQFLENREIVGFLKMFGFVKRKDDWNVYYYCSEELLERFPVLEDSEAWLLTNFDMDN